MDKINKRKGQTAWGESVNKAPKAGGWGSNNSAQAWDSGSQGGAQTGGWGQGSAPVQSRNGGKGKGKGGKGKGKAPYPPAGNPPPASFGGNAAPVGAERGRPGPNQCAYCFKEGHYKDTCPELLAQNAKWNNGW